MCCLKDCNQIQAYFIKSYDLWKYYKIQYEKGYYIPKKYIKANKMEYNIVYWFINYIASSYVTRD